jgi:membrane protease subunit HflC
MSQKGIIASIIAMVILLTALMSIFTVKQTEKALVLFLGRIVRFDFEPGLHFKLPILQQVRKFDARIQTLDSMPEQFLTVEKKNLIVDSFVKWRIVDVASYFRTTGGIEQRASQRLTEIIADGLRSEFGKRTIQEVVSDERAKLMELIIEQSNPRVQSLGIVIVDVRIKRIELPKEVSTSVYRRMEAERERVAKEFRSRGEAAAVRIQAQADRESTEVIAKAERDAEQIRGESDALATKIYADAYNKNSEFYLLYRSLNAYKTVFKGPNNILVIEPDSDFFSYFKNSQLLVQPPLLPVPEKQSVGVIKESHP